MNKTLLQNSKNKIKLKKINDNKKIYWGQIKKNFSAAFLLFFINGTSENFLRLSFKKI